MTTDEESPYICSVKQKNRITKHEKEDYECPSERTGKNGRKRTQQQRVAVLKVPTGIPQAVRGIFAAFQFPCHFERSEKSVSTSGCIQMLHCIQHDNLRGGLWFRTDSPVGAYEHK